MPAPSTSKALRLLQAEITACRACRRLVEHCQTVARDKRRSYSECTYWGKPVPSFGDPKARLVIIGLAPGAHGANRTGRVFTGDRSGDFLFRAMYETGFASQPESVGNDDGLTLRNAYITMPVHCAPPGNKPTREEFAACRAFLTRELELLTHAKAVVVLGRHAFDSYAAFLVERGVVPRRSSLRFGHGNEFSFGGSAPALICSFHPSQQNTFTGRLTAEMLERVFLAARRAIELS